MSRYPSTAPVHYQFGPGGITPAVRAILVTCAAIFVASLVWRDAVLDWLGLIPHSIVTSFTVWQPLTYIFVHDGVFHLAFNMLGIWMFGVELERLWGTRFFARYYAITGIGAGLTMIAVALMPLDFSDRLYFVTTVGASGAIFGLLLAYGLYFPDRRIYMYFLFPIKAKYFVMIIGAISLWATVADQDGGIAHAAHLGGLAIGYVYLKTGRTRFNPLAELRYYYLRWKINRLRKRFDVYSGGRADDVDRRIH